VRSQITNFPYKIIEFSSLFFFLKGSAEYLKKRKKYKKPKKNPNFCLGAYRRIQSRASLDLRATAWEN
jgi:hypothetical protein